MKKPQMKKLYIILSSLLIFYLLVASSKSLTGDEANHGLASLFYYSMFGHIMKEGLSPSSIINFAADYHAHYKVFSALYFYPPLQHIITLPFIMLFGTYAVFGKLVVVLEALVLLLMLFRTAGLFFRGSIFPMLAVLMLGLHPVFVSIVTSQYLDVGMTAAMMASVYYFVLYLRKEKPRDLYLSAAALGVSVLFKPMAPLLIVAFLATMFLEKKLPLVRKHGLTFLKAAALFILVMSPYILFQAFISSQVGSEGFFAKWTSSAQTGRLLPSLEWGVPVYAWNSHETELDVLYSLTDWQEFTKNITTFLFQVYMIPFFILGCAAAFRRKRQDVGKISFLLFVATLYLFTAVVHAISLKHLVMALPFIVLLCVSGMESFFRLKRFSKFRKFIPYLVLAFIILSLVQTAFYLDSLKKSQTAVDFIGVAGFVAGRAQAPLSVLTSHDAAQCLAFAAADLERNVYCIHMPRNSADLEKALANDFSFANEEAWERFGIRHPDIAYVIVHESSVQIPRFDFGFDSFNARVNLKLIKTFGSPLPGDRTFVYEVV